MEDEYSNERNEKHGRCSTCNRYNTDYSWCQSCDPELLTRGWTSNNEAIDELIKSSQLKATQYGSIYFLEWIPYNNLTDIVKIGQGGFATVYKAKWINGLKYIGENNKRCCADTIVALKRLHEPQNITDDFLQEFKNYTKLHTRLGVIRPYGLTQDPETKEYVFVMKYFESGNLCDYIKREPRNLDWKHKVNLLYDIIFGLSAIHDNNLIHHDFHSGNILIQKYDNKIRSCISDLGLSVPADYRPTSGKTATIGVLAYVAPEVLNGAPYTPKSDIYSLGVIMSVISAEQQPFSDVPHDTDLAINICQGVRPGFSKNTPENYIELANRCMDADPNRRPTAKEVKKIIWFWKDSFEDDLSSVYVNGHGYSKEELDEMAPIRQIFESMDRMDFGPSKITATDAVYTSSILHFTDLPQAVNLNQVLNVGNNNDSHQIDLLITEEFPI